MIKVFDYRALLPEIQGELSTAFERVLASGRLILGPETEAFEQEFARTVGAPHAVAVTSGTMAIFVALKALGVGAGDEVITVANTCAPTIAAIRMTGADPVFVDVRADTLMMDPGLLRSRIGDRTRCILPVHLWGNSVDIDDIGQIARERRISIVEDCAQAMGTRYRGRPAGTFGDMGCFSFYPTKNLGAYGDGGAIVTGSAERAAQLRKLRMYGYDPDGSCVIDGFNARINELQAALLRVKLKVFDRWQARRARNAAHYERILGEYPRPSVQPEVEHAYHQYVVHASDRERTRSKLVERGIETGVHYPVPVHRMPAYEAYRVPLPVTERASGTILSLPVHEGLDKQQIETVCRELQRIGT